VVPSDGIGFPKYLPVSRTATLGALKSGDAVLDDGLGLVTVAGPLAALTDVEPPAAEVGSLTRHRPHP